MIITGGSSGFGRTGKMLLFASACLVASAAQPAGAQGIFKSLFGSAPRFVRPSLPPQIRSYADPSDRRETRRHSGDSGGSSGHSTVFCVRTCDGRYFPLQHHTGVSPAKLCQAFCPASQTMVFSGSKIDYAVAHNGRHYADLDTAFAYRDKVVENCTCNGKDGLGLAQIDVADDQTLRRGDIVATNDGFMSYRGKNSKSAEFSPINPSSSTWARRLSEVEIRPSLPSAKINPVQQTDEHAELSARHDPRRAQLSR